MVNNQYHEKDTKMRLLELEIRLKQYFEKNTTHTQKISEN